MRSERTWQPLSRSELDSMIADGLRQYDEAVRSDWEANRIEPAKWSCSPWGDEGGGFWAVAIKGDQVLWFNDIEDGFNWSRFAERGVIGEYWCNQTDFDSILEDFARARSESAWTSVSSTDVPEELGGPGRIVKRQTTHWELEAESGITFRVDFKGKEEFFFAEGRYPSATILDEHALLLDYHEPNLNLYVAGTPIDAGKLANQIDQRIQRTTSGWRALCRYVNISPEKLLVGGHGLFMRAPEFICTAATEILAEAGIGATTPGRRIEGGRQRLLLLGKSYVIANEFGFQPSAGRT